MRSTLEVADIFRRHGTAYAQAHDGHLGRVERVERARAEQDLDRGRALRHALHQADEPRVASTVAEGGELERPPPARSHD